MFADLGDEFASSKTSESATSMVDRSLLKDNLGGCVLFGDPDGVDVIKFLEDDGLTITEALASSVGMSTKSFNDLEVIMFRIGAKIRPDS